MPHERKKHGATPEVCLGEVRGALHHVQKPGAEVKRGASGAVGYLVWGLGVEALRCGVEE